MLPYALPPAESRLPLKSILQGFTSGPHDFAGELKKILKVQECLLANSARSLLFLVLKNLSNTSTSSKDEVLIPGYTCYSVPAAVVKAGLKVNLYDLEPGTFQPDLADLNKKLTSRTLAVVGQHLLGVKSDIKNIAAIAGEREIWSIEDSAQLLEKKILNQKNDAGADFTMFSFGRGKPLPLGHGGALVARKYINISELKDEIRKLPTGNAKKTFTPILLKIFSLPAFYWFLEKMPLGLGRTIYDPGFKVHGMSEFYQRIGETAARDLDRLNRHRSLISEIYNKAFGSVSDSKNTTAPHVRYPLLVDQQEEVDRLAEYGVRRLYPQALCDLEELKPQLADPDVQTPGARKISRQLITLPTHLGVSEKMACKISKRVTEGFSKISTLRY